MGKECASEAAAMNNVAGCGSNATEDYAGNGVGKTVINDKTYNVARKKMRKEYGVEPVKRRLTRRVRSQRKTPP